MKGGLDEAIFSSHPQVSWRAVQYHALFLRSCRWLLGKLKLFKSEAQWFREMISGSFSAWEESRAHAEILRHRVLLKKDWMTNNNPYINNKFC